MTASHQRHHWKNMVAAGCAAAVIVSASLVTDSFFAGRVNDDITSAFNPARQSLGQLDGHLASIEQHLSSIERQLDINSLYLGRIEKSLDAGDAALHRHKNDADGRHEAKTRYKEE